MMPTPSHLTKCVTRKDTVIDESPLEADVDCPCGSNMFELFYPGQTTEYNGSKIPVVAEIDSVFFFLIRARCTQCSREHLLLDKDFHGWEGFVCHDKEQAIIPRPELTKWHCLTCGKTPHQACIQIQTAGKQDFIEESEGMFNQDQWPDAFAWFSMRLLVL